MTDTKELSICQHCLWDLEKHMTEQRTPWFNARNEPPINGDLGALYEVRCSAELREFVILRPKKAIWNKSCRYCQWRGLLSPDPDPGSG